MPTQPHPLKRSGFAPFGPIEVSPPALSGEQLFVVGIGASAAGLEALKLFFDHMPPGPMCFIVVQQRAQNDDSSLPRLIAQVSSMTVELAREGTKVAHRHIYIVPAQVEAQIKDGRLALLERSGWIPNLLPIDSFLHSLAADQGSQAVGLVLSGTGSDGTEGLEAIRKAGGITAVQSPLSAQVSGLAKSATSCVSADICLDPAGLAHELSALTRGQDFAQKKAGIKAQRGQLQRLMAVLEQKGVIDLSEYKLSTLDRRIERRMSLKNIHTLEEYVRYVEQDGQESALLVKDLLISVTCFFRDKSVFERLREVVLPKLLLAKKKGECLRLWSVGCATGEEPYSLAMTVRSVMDELNIEHPVKIFSTDLDANAIRHAQKGLYCARVLQDVSQENVSKYFSLAKESYLIDQKIREMVVFSEHNFLKDPPFAHLDLISCRNSFIYVQPSAQRRVLVLMHYALQDQGFLLLGEAESAASSLDLFEPTDRRIKIYAKRRIRTIRPSFSLSPLRRGDAFAPLSPALEKHRKIKDAANDLVVSFFAGVMAVVDKEYRVVELRGDLQRFLNIQPGVEAESLLRMISPSLHSALKLGMQRASRAKEMIEEEGVCRRSEGVRHIRMRVAKILELHETGDYFVVCLEEVRAEPLSGNWPRYNDGAAKKPVDGQEAGDISALQKELNSIKILLSMVEEDQGSAAGGSKSYGQGLQASNASLRQANEQLETSQEEFQSANEQLLAVNEDLQHKIDDLSSIQTEMNNVLNHIGLPLLIVDQDMTLRRCSSAAASLFDIGPYDTGRSVQFIRRFFVDLDVGRHIETAMAKLLPAEKVIKHMDNSRYRLSIRPFRDLEACPSGCLLLFSKLKQGRSLFKRMLRTDLVDYADRSWGRKDQPLAIVSDTLVGVWANGQFCERFSLIREQFVGKSLLDPAFRSIFNEQMLRLMKENMLAAGVYHFRLDSHEQTSAKAYLRGIDFIRLKVLGTTGLFRLRFLIKNHGWT